MDPLNLNIFRTSKAPASLNLFPMDNSFYGMGKKTKRKATNHTNDLMDVANFALKAGVTTAVVAGTFGALSQVSRSVQH